MTTAASLDLSFLKELGLDGPQQGAYAGAWLPCSGEELEVRRVLSISAGEDGCADRG